MSSLIGQIVAILRQLQTELPPDASRADWERACTERLPNHVTDEDIFAAVRILREEDRTISDPSWRRFAN